ncbi:MAG: adenylosuccinate synthetase [Myxococcota bacterium]
MKAAWIVVDLGFGDAGKGTITDFLVRDRGARLVVRFNGGAQAGHNVVTADGRHHTFSQIGAGSFVPDVRTLLGPAFLMHPMGMAVEARHLDAVGVPDIWSRLAVDARARVISPFHQAANRLRETRRGDQAHGTCGVGVGECARGDLEHPEETISAADLLQPDILAVRLRMQRQRLAEELPILDGSPDSDLLHHSSAALIDRIIADWTGLARQLWVTPPEESHQLIRDALGVVFEGAQGILLDEHRGFHPHTTWSTCTPHGALAMLAAAHDARPVTRLGVTRAYMARHGPGPLPTEDPDLKNQLEEPHNVDGGWQGPFRVGALDGVLLRYAVTASGGLDGIVVTCLDQIVASKAPVCHVYHHPQVTMLPLGVEGDLDHQRRLTRLLQKVRPEICWTDDVIGFVETATGLPVVLTSHGPTATDKRWCTLRKANG